MILYNNRRPPNQHSAMRKILLICSLLGILLVQVQANSGFVENALDTAKDTDQLSKINHHLNLTKVDSIASPASVIPNDLNASNTSAKSRKLNQKSHLTNLPNSPALKQTSCLNPTTGLNLLNTDVLVGQSDFYYPNAQTSDDPNVGCDMNFEQQGLSTIVQADKYTNEYYWIAEFTISTFVQTVLLSDRNDGQNRFSKYFVTVGDDDQVLNNPSCIATGSMTTGGWFTCGKNGKYFAIISLSDFVNFVEVMLYSKWAVQMKASSVSLTSQDTLYPMLNILKSLFDYTTFGSCVSSTLATDPQLVMTLKAAISIDAVVLLGSKSLNWPTWQLNVDVYVQNFSDPLQFCGRILNYNTYSEMKCGYFGNKIVLIKLSGSTTTQLTACAVGVLATLNCAATSFDQILITTPAVPGLVSATSITKYWNNATPQIVLLDSTIPDTISSTFEIADGTTTCGDRTLKYFDGLGVAITFPYKKVQRGLNQLVLGATTHLDIGNFTIRVEISLQNYPSVKYFNTIAFNVLPLIAAVASPVVIPIVTIVQVKQAPCTPLFFQLFEMNATIGYMANLTLPATEQYEVVSTQHCNATIESFNNLTVSSIDEADVGTTNLILQTVANNITCQTRFKVRVNFLTNITFVFVSNLTSVVKQTNGLISSTDTVVNQTQIDEPTPPQATPFCSFTIRQSSTFVDNLLQTLDFSTNKTLDSQGKEWLFDNLSGYLKSKNVLYGCQDYPPPPVISISDVSSTGFLRLNFSKPMNFTKLTNTSWQRNLDLELNQTSGLGRVLRSQSYQDEAVNLTNRYKYLLSDEHINITALSGGFANDSQLEFWWFADDITETEITIRIVFTTPVYVSSNNYIKDSLNIKLLQPSMIVFRSMWYEQFIQNSLGQVTIRVLPNQLDKDVLTISAQSFYSYLGISSQSQFVLNIIAAIFLSGTLAQMWSIVNALQITLAFPFLGFQMPANVYLMVNQISYLSTFNFIQAKKGIDAIFTFTPTDDPGAGFHEMGITSYRFIPLLSSLFFFMLAYFLAGFIHGFTFCLRKKHRYFDNIRQKIQKHLYWVRILEFFMESYLDAATGILLSLELIKYATPSDVFDLLLAVIWAISIVVILVWSFFFLKCNQDRFQDKKFKEKYGELTEIYRETKWYQLQFAVKMVPWFCVRRLMMAVIITRLRRVGSGVQLMCNMWLTLIDVCITFHLDPFANEVIAKIEKFNAVCVLTLCQSIYLLTDYQQEPIVKYRCGWIFNAVVTVMLVANLLLMFIVTFRVIILRCKGLHSRRLHRLAMALRQKNVQSKPAVQKLEGSEAPEESSSYEESEPESSTTAKKMLVPELEDQIQQDSRQKDGAQQRQQTFGPENQEWVKELEMVYQQTDPIKNNKVGSSDPEDRIIQLDHKRRNIVKSREQIVNDIFAKNPPHMIKPYDVELFCTYLPDDFTEMSPQQAMDVVRNFTDMVDITSPLQICQKQHCLDQRANRE